MSREELLKTEFSSVVDAMNALNEFIEKNASMIGFDSGEAQGLYVLGNRIYD